MEGPGTAPALAAFAVPAGAAGAGAGAIGVDGSGGCGRTDGAGRSPGSMPRGTTAPEQALSNSPIAAIAAARMSASKHEPGRPIARIAAGANPLQAASLIGSGPRDRVLRPLPRGGSTACAG
jgi:hypothetical protein